MSFKVSPLHIIQLQHEGRKQKSVKEVTLQISMIFQIRLKNNTVNFRVICPLSNNQ